MLLLQKTTQSFYTSSKKIFCPTSITWQDIEHLPNDIIEIPLTQAVKILQSSSEHKIRTPIGIIGTRTPTQEQYEKAEILGKEIANLGFTVLCGGKTGVMEAACKGVMQANGTSIGLLPDENPSFANPFVTIPIASGIGVARNALIARASLCLVVIGGGYGTISEIAYGLQFGKTVLSIEKEPHVDGMEHLSSVDKLIERICTCVLNIT